uniref:Na_H_Exchanger domain-containing protein n=1 Tax=Macrostomum lignano TaxID=282301 RepID=A0A1I8GBK7_9PLAT
AVKEPPDGSVREMAEPPSACTRCCDRTCYNWCLAERHQLPDDPSIAQKLHHDLLCPPHGRTGRLLTGITILLLMYATLWSLVPDRSVPGSCVTAQLPESTNSSNSTKSNQSNAGTPSKKLNCTGGLFGLYLVFTISMLTGELFGLIPRCPKLLGMLIAGCFMRSVPFLAKFALGIDKTLSSTLRSVALCIILLRAGLGLDPKRLRALSLHVVLLAFSPCITEAVTIGFASHLLLKLPWTYGFLLGFVLAAVSPAVVVPSMLAIGSEGYGVAKGIPTLLIAAASVDDVLAITGFGVLLSVVFGGNESLALTIARGPLEALLGIVVGLILGVLLWFLPPAGHRRFLFFRFCFLLASGIISLLGSVALKLHGAGALACLTVAFMAAIGWRSRDGWSDEENPLWKSAGGSRSRCFSALSALKSTLGAFKPTPIGFILATLFIGLLFRMIAAFVAVTGAGFTVRERFFIPFAWLPKATVQAVIGPAVLDTAYRTGAGPKAQAMGAQILTVSVLAIVITAPLGAILISLLAPRLLNRQVLSFEEKFDTEAAPPVRRSDIDGRNDSTADNDENVNGTAT